MNALANDQMKRLRQVLANHPQITFGIYTGETKERDSIPMQSTGACSKRPTANGQISRSDEGDTTAHLLTNAMLEYLMLRPEDHVFSGSHAGRWKFIVLDEAHTYAGAKGIEMSMLLAHLKNALARPVNCGAS